jgi:hypothetical protein
MSNKKELTNQLEVLKANHAADVERLEAQIKAMPDDTPSRWVPAHNGTYWIVVRHGSVEQVYWGGVNGDKYRLSIGNVHRTKEDAEAYRLRIESFVPCYGYEVPSDEVLAKGWVIKADGRRFVAVKADPSWVAWWPGQYLEGTWHPTKESAEAWLAKFGKCRGYK